MTRMNSGLVGCWWLRGGIQVKALKTHFEQVPVETVKCLADAEVVEKGKTVKLEVSPPGIAKKDRP